MPDQFADTPRHLLERAMLSMVVGRFESVARPDEGWQHGLEGARLSGSHPRTTLELDVVDRVSGERSRQSVELWTSNSNGLVELLERIQAVHRELVAGTSVAKFGDDYAVHARSVLATVVSHFHHTDVAGNDLTVLRGAWVEGRYPDTALTINRYDRSTGEETLQTWDLWRGSVKDAAAGDLEQSAFFIWVWGSGG